MAAMRSLASLGFELLTSRVAPSVQQLSSLRGLTALPSLPDGPSMGSIAAASLAGWHRVTAALIPSWADAQWLAAPKQKVGALGLIQKIAIGLGCAFVDPPVRHRASLTATVPFRPQVSPHRKGKRSANKGIRFIPIVAKCSKCDRVFPPHALPSKCDEEACPAFNLRERPAASFKRSAGDE
jgi:ribosomal protein L32